VRRAALLLASLATVLLLGPSPAAAGKPAAKHKPAAHAAPAKKTQAPPASTTRI